MKKTLWFLLLLGTGCTNLLLLNSFRLFEGKRLAAISKPTPSASSSFTGQPSSPRSSVDKTPAIYKSGETFQLEKMDLKVVGIKSLGKSLVISKNDKLDAVGTWQAVAIDITNTNRSTNSLTVKGFVLKASDGKTYDSSDAATNHYVLINDNLALTKTIAKVLPSTPLLPSASARTYLLFDVTRGTQGVQLIIKPLAESDQIMAKIDLREL